jgi:putative acetyltransferase
MVYVDVV